MGNGSFPIDAAQVVGLFMESVFYGSVIRLRLEAYADSSRPVLILGRATTILGIFLVTFFHCMRVLLWGERQFKSLRIVNKKMLIAALLMFTFATMDVAFHLRHNLEAFVYFDADPIETFDKTSNWINVMKMGCYVAQTFVGDAILIFRCWIVYNRNYLVIILPVLLWLGTTVCGIMTIYVEATLNSSSGKLLNSSTLVPFITSMLCLTLAANVLTTGLIVYRIWKVRGGVKHRGTAILPGSPLTKVLVVLIESGLLYTASIVILFGLYLASNNGQYGVSNAVVQIIGITFNLVITSVNRNESQSTNTTSRSQTGYGGSRSVPMHMISIQTTVSRYPDGQDHADSQDPADSVKTKEGAKASDIDFS